MKATILKSENPDIPIGSTHSVKSQMNGGWNLSVTAHFQTASGGKETDTRECFFPADAVEIIYEPAPVSEPGGPGFAFVSAFNWAANKAHTNARAKGFWDDRDKLQKLADANGLGAFCKRAADSQLIALMHAELSEALEGTRSDLMDDHLPAFTMQETEIADVFIRGFDFAKARGLRVAQAIVAKMQYNEARPPMHGKKF